jgi:8-oxo-dGTP pyrophosphatase MutT (NUDIX family)
MSKPNWTVKDENGQDQWISRSVVVIPIVFKLDIQTNDIYCLLEKRGSSVTHTGEWCCPCGYIDWDESLEEACVREVREETGITINKDRIHFFEVASDKYSKSQSVDLWYECWVDDTVDYHKDTRQEILTPDEVQEIKWLKVAHMDTNNLNIDVQTINNGFGKWAFKSHHTHIVSMLESRFKHICNIKKNGVI